MFSLWQRADTNSNAVYLNNVLRPCQRRRPYQPPPNSTSNKRMRISSVVVSMRLPRWHSRHFRDVSFNAMQQTGEGGGA